MKDYYEILGIGQDADAYQIKAAYYRLAREYNPALHPGDAEMENRFADIEEAYDTLKETDMRATYDEELLHMRKQENAWRSQEQIRLLESRHGWKVVLTVLVVFLHFATGVSECNRSTEVSYGGTTIYPSLDSFLRATKSDSGMSSARKMLLDSSIADGQDTFK